MLKKKMAPIKPKAEGKEEHPNPQKDERYRRRKRKLSKMEALMLVIPAVAAVVAAAAIFLVMGKAGVTPVGENAVQYYAGNSFSLPKDAKVKQEKNGKTLLITGEGNREIGSLPIYYKDKPQVMMPKDMVFFAPREARDNLAPGRTWVEVDNYKSIRFISKKETKEETGGFLFDGKDTYLFLEDMELSLNGYKMILPPLSYAEAVYGDQVIVFNYETKEFIQESAKGEVLAKVLSGDYTIDLLSDSVTMYDGERFMMFTRPEVLDPVVKY